MTRVSGYRTRNGKMVRGYSRRDRGLGVSPRNVLIPAHLQGRDSYGIFRKKMRRR